MIIGSTWGADVAVHKAANHSSIQQNFREIVPFKKDIQCIFLIHLPEEAEDRIELLNQARLYSQFTLIPSIIKDYYVG